MDATTLWLLIALTLALGVVIFFRFPAPKPPADPSTPQRLQALCGRLTGEPAQDEAVVNQILTLGADIIPLLLDGLGQRCAAGHPPPPAQQAALEGLIGHFGLAAHPALCQRAQRFQLTDSDGPLLLRLIRGTGPGGARLCLERALGQPQLDLLIPHLRHGDGDAALIARQALRRCPPERVGRALDLLACWCADAPGLILSLYTDWAAGDHPRDEARRGALLVALRRWGALITPALLDAALGDPEPAPRLEAARLLYLCPEAVTAEALRALTHDGQPEIRREGWRLALLQPEAPALDLDERDLGSALTEPDPEAALWATLARWRHGGRLPPRPEALDDALWAQLNVPGPDPVATLARRLDTPGPERSPLTLWALALTKPSDPRVQERLMLLAAHPYAPDQATALAALILTGVQASPDLLTAALGDQPAPSPLLLWCRTQLRDPAPALARAVHKRGPQRGLLSLLSAGPLTSAVASLLRALERGPLGPESLAIASTLYVASRQADGEEIRDTLRAALEQTGRGLTAAALRHCAVTAPLDALPSLARIHQRHPGLLPLALNVLEGAGAPAVAPLAAAVAAGGDDEAMAALEDRLEILRCCGLDPDARPATAPGGRAGGGDAGRPVA